MCHAFVEELARASRISCSRSAAREPTPDANLPPALIAAGLHLRTDLVAGAVEVAEAPSKLESSKTERDVAEHADTVRTFRICPCRVVCASGS